VNSDVEAPIEGVDVLPEVKGGEGTKRPFEVADLGVNKSLELAERDDPLLSLYHYCSRWRTVTNGRRISFSEFIRFLSLLARTYMTLGLGARLGCLVALPTG